MGIIDVKNLERTYVGHERGHGLREAIKSLFRRKKVLSHAVKHISFSIEEGEIVGFIGPNGAGKSTTIKMLTGILHPSGGDVSALGYTPWRQRQEYVKHIGVVFGQKSQLWWDLPPIDSFHLAKGIYRIPEQEFCARLERMTKMLRIEGIIKRPTRDLSLGERMKCDFVMALLHNPRILFLDEPTIGVDALAKEEIREFLKSINREYKTTIILTTHDMDDIEEVCERIIIIDKGSIIYDGQLEKVKREYTKTKTVEIEFAKVTSPRAFEQILDEGMVLAERKNYRSVEFPVAHAPKAIKELMECCDVIDLVVHEPDLETIIKEIYKGTAREQPKAEESPLQSG